MNKDSIDFRVSLTGYDSIFNKQQQQQQEESNNKRVISIVEPITPQFTKSMIKKTTSNIRAACMMESKKLLVVEIENVFPGMPSLDKDIIVCRMASQLTNWAVYGEIPIDLKSKIGNKAANDIIKEAKLNLDMPNFIKTNRSRDAALLFSNHKHGGGGDDGDLDEKEILIACNNLAYMDIDKIKHQKPAVSESMAIQDVCAILVNNLFSVINSPLNIILNSARSLINGDGIFLQTKTTEIKDFVQCILVCKKEAERLLFPSFLKEKEGKVDDIVSEQQQLCSSSSRSSKFGSERIPPLLNTCQQEDIKKKLEIWRHAQKDFMQEKEKRRRLPDNHTIRSMFIENKSKAGEIAYETTNRMSDYKPIPKAGLPIRVSLPVPRPLFLAFMQQHRSTFENIAMWRMTLDVVLPTCPMVNILVDGPLQYHMSSHAMLEEYLTLIRFAVDRVGCPGFSIFSNENVMIRNINQQRQQQHDKKSEFRKKMSTLAFLPLRANKNAWCGLPKWCGDWFLPEAYMKKPTNQFEFDCLYPLNTMERIVFQEVWTKKNNQVIEVSPTELLQAFHKKCLSIEPAPPEPSSLEVKKELNAQEKINKIAKDRESIFMCPDRSLEGRAETIMVAAGIRAYYQLIQASLVSYNKNIDKLRKKYGKGLDCGNGFHSVRPSSYYEELWQFGIHYTAEILEIHEITLVLIHGRWLETDKLKHRLIDFTTRISMEAVNDIDDIIVSRIIKRRKQTIMHRIRVDGRNETLKLGLARPPPNKHGVFVTSTSSAASSTGGAAAEWLYEQIRVSGGEKVRKDAPTYIEMIIFDHLIDYVPSKHENDKDINNLIKRTKQMSVYTASEAARNPEAYENQHIIPFNLNNLDSNNGHKRHEKDINTSTSTSGGICTSKKTLQQRRIKKHFKNKELL